MKLVRINVFPYCYRVCVYGRWRASRFCLYFCSSLLFFLAPQCQNPTPNFSTTGRLTYGRAARFCWYIQVDPAVYNMAHENPGAVDYAAIGGLGEQIRELRESIELPLMNPELFLRVGIKPPKVGSIQLAF